jgi:tryptophan-rich sensory protein
VFFILAVTGIGLVIGFIAPTGDWFEALAKPRFMAPEWFHRGAWLIVYVLLAIVGWRLWLIDSAAGATRLWATIVILSWWFTPALFLMRSPPIALAVVASLGLLMLALACLTWRFDRISSLLLLPCIAAVLYAVGVTAAIVMLNGAAA